jgi:hypothetical protein
MQKTFSTLISGTTTLNEITLERKKKTRTAALLLRGREQERQKQRQIVVNSDKIK